MNAPGCNTCHRRLLAESGRQRRPGTPRAPRTARAIGGFTLVEMMVATALFVVVMAGVSGLYLAHRNARISEDLNQTVEAELRLGMDKLLFRLRNAPYGIPSGGAPLPSWVTWVTGFDDNPKITAGASASDPDTISVAGCTSTPVAWIDMGDAGAVAGATTLTVGLGAGANFDASSRSVIMINDSVSAKILSVSGDDINIDTNLNPVYRTGTPICRLDIATYSVDTATSTLREDLNQGAGPQVIVDGITNMKIASDTTGVAPQYTITLTARASATDPLTTQVAQRSLMSIATARMPM